MSDYVIETRGLTKQYGVQTSVSDLSIHVRQGRIYGLLGRNGAGKTTTMRMLLGLTDPSSGTVSLFGKPLRGNEKKILPRIGSLIESPGFYPNLTGTENLRIFADLRGLKSPKYIKSALEVVNLPYRDKKLFSQYSLGMKQRLAIALAIMHNPELLILDEPINGLDPIGIAEVRDFIRELCDATGKTILISSHILSEIALLADDVGIIDHGVGGRRKPGGAGSKEWEIFPLYGFQCRSGRKAAVRKAGHSRYDCGQRKRADRPGSAPGYGASHQPVCGGRADGIRCAPV